MSTALTRLSWRSLIHEPPTARLSETHRCVFRRVASFTARWNDVVRMVFHACGSKVVSSPRIVARSLQLERSSLQFWLCSFSSGYSVMELLITVLCFFGISIFFDTFRLIGWWCSGIWNEDSFGILVVIRHAVVDESFFTVFFFFFFYLDLSHTQFVNFIVLWITVYFWQSWIWWIRIIQVISNFVSNRNINQYNHLNYYEVWFVLLDIRNLINY